ncbi:hypothetical protein Rhsp01_10530 [Rhizobium sp. NBRC 114257]|nr:hypothetical protein Rhsp01_10530 [Rhizobium sp. NBRC 114257]
MLGGGDHMRWRKLIGVTEIADHVPLFAQRQADGIAEFLTVSLCIRSCRGKDGNGRLQLLGARSVYLCN